MPPPTSQFSGIFVSYRRDDTSGHAGRLFDRLVSHFGKERMFMDIDTIEPGEDFVTVIENAVGSCAILIAIIGRHWLSGSAGAMRQLDNPNDIVRLEIATALSRDIRVIPVLVQRAAMPNPEDLPDDLAKLARRNAVELSDLRWQNDVDQLINALERVLGKHEEAARLGQLEGQVKTKWVRRHHMPEDLTPQSPPRVVPRPNNPTGSIVSYTVVFVVVLGAIVGAAVVISNYVSITAGVTLGVVIIGALLAIGVVGAMQLKNDDRLSEKGFLELMIESYKRLPLLRGER